MDTIAIHYRRPPGREEVFHQRVVHRAEEYTVTLLESARLQRPVEVDGHPVLEPGAAVVWFTYPGRWYDIGRFHLRNGRFTGYYANIITPVRMEGARWDTTDLFLDVWKGADGTVALLDEAEFEEAAAAGWIDAPTAAAAREHADTLAAVARQDLWPPEHVQAWTLERVLDGGPSNHERH